MNPVTVERPHTPGAGSAEAAAGQEGAPQPGFTLNVELLAWATVAVLAAALRLIDLRALPLGPAESLHARAALEFSRGVVSPDWGGDLTSALAALSLRLFGDTATAVRIVPALLGVGAVLAMALYRPLVGRGAALIAAVLLAISPVAVVTARTLGPEAAALPLALLLPPLAAAVFLNGRIERLPMLAAVAGFGLGSGALFLATALIVLVWLAVEHERTKSDAGRSAPAGLRNDRTLLALTVLAALPGAILAVVRYGAGPAREPLAAAAAWSGPPLTARLLETWSFLPSVLLGYEPLVLVLGAVGFVLAARRWSSTTPGERLAAIWAAAGLVLVALWLHRDPGHVLVLIVPLTLLGGIATARVFDGRPAASDESDAAKGWFLDRWRGPALLMLLVPVLGYTLVAALRWANAGRIDSTDLRSVATALGAGCVAVVWLAWSRPPPWPALMLGAWLLFGGLTLHAATNAAFTGGSEILTGIRTVPEVESVVQQLDGTAPLGAAVWVERRLWPSLAWPLRNRPVRQFVEVPPDGPAVLAVRLDGVGRTAAPPNAVPITERWAPATGSLVGWLRWWVFREAWGRVERIGAVVER
jgi:4-amino-4-deoxy-L-arabinose transferase-like glycosyltransferase